MLLWKSPLAAIFGHCRGYFDGTASIAAVGVGATFLPARNNPVGTAQARDETGAKRWTCAAKKRPRIGGASVTQSKDFEPVAIKPTVSLEDVEKLDIRVGTIERVEDVPRSDTLVRLTVDFGDHRRSILVGTKRERPDASSEVEGRQALFVVNLASRKMAGEISEGMLFDIGHPDGLLPVLAVPEKPVPNGCRAG